MLGSLTLTKLLGPSIGLLTTTGAGVEGRGSASAALRSWSALEEGFDRATRTRGSLRVLSLARITALVNSGFDANPGSLKTFSRLDLDNFETILRAAISFGVNTWALFKLS